VVLSTDEAAKKDGVTEDWIKNAAELCLRRNNVPHWHSCLSDIVRAPQLVVTVTAIYDSEKSLTAFSIGLEITEIVFTPLTDSLGYASLRPYRFSETISTQNKSAFKQRFRETLDSGLESFCADYQRSRVLTNMRLCERWPKSATEDYRQHLIALLDWLASKVGDEESKRYFYADIAFTICLKENDPWPIPSTQSATTQPDEFQQAWDRSKGKVPTSRPAEITKSNP
jgi:hypothetical protein